MTTLREAVLVYAQRAADPANAAARSFVALLAGALQNRDPDVAAAVWSVISDTDPLA